jgi:prolyl-tRNA editing enzyme YbaK/EbsC (Cys-tRNA(Pro) deacylase)
VEGVGVWGLNAFPASAREDLLAEPVAAALRGWSTVAPSDLPCLPLHGEVPSEGEVLVAPIDPNLADTAAFCAAYDVPAEDSANCVVVAGKRAGQTALAACVILATTRANVNSVIRRHLGARKATLAPQEEVVQASGMEYGGITPLGLPREWPILVDSAAAAREQVVIGSGLRRSKIVLPGRALGAIPGAEIIDGLASPVA